MNAENLIKKYTPVYLKAHPCLCGYWVISYWLRFYPDSGKAVQPGDEMTLDEADELLRQHLDKLELPERRWLPNGEWPNNQREALKSIMHYLQEDWAGSELKHALEAGDWAVAKELWLNLGMPEWRQEEVELFFGAAG